jgi:hypothetical protein
MMIRAATTVAARTTKKALHEGEAVGVRTEKSDESLVLTPEGHVHLLLLSGEDPNEPVVGYGPFGDANSQREGQEQRGGHSRGHAPRPCVQPFGLDLRPTDRELSHDSPGNVSHDILHGAGAARGRDHAAVESRVGAGRGVLSGSGVMDRRGDDGIISTDDTPSVRVDLRHVDQDEYQRLTTGEFVIVTGTIADDANRVFATSIERAAP